ncbi:hypothetical protein [Actinomadura sp. CNU-125]|uniref:hypothetical protein n=1 Tax=Actinomadura sp. CNU-125 TaxID=1904961 RepID=UPI00396780A0
MPGDERRDPVPDAGVEQDPEVPARRVLLPRARRPAATASASAYGTTPSRGSCSTRAGRSRSPPSPTTSQCETGTPLRRRSSR